MTGFVIWYTDQPYICGAGVDGDIYDTREDAEDGQWVTGRDTSEYHIVEYVECDDEPIGTSTSGSSGDPAD